MPKDLSGKIFSHDLESPIPASQIMDFNLIVKPSGDTVAIWEKRISILLQLIHKGMDRPRLSIRS